MGNEEVKTMKIRESIHKKLHDMGNKDETFSDIIDRLIDFYKSKGGK